MKTQTIDGEMLIKMFRYGAKNLEINKRIVDELNVFPVPGLPQSKTPLGTLAPIL